MHQFSSLVSSSGFCFGSSVLLAFTGMECAKALPFWLGLITSTFGAVTALIIMLYWMVKLCAAFRAYQHSRRERKVGNTHSRPR